MCSEYQITVELHDGKFIPSEIQERTFSKYSQVKSTHLITSESIEGFIGLEKNVSLQPNVA